MTLSNASAALAATSRRSGSRPGVYCDEQTVEAGGIGREFEDRAVQMGPAVPDSQSLSHEIDAEGFKRAADVLVSAYRSRCGERQGARGR